MRFYAHRLQIKGDKLFTLIFRQSVHSRHRTVRIAEVRARESVIYSIVGVISPVMNDDSVVRTAVQPSAFDESCNETRWVFIPSDRVSDIGV